MHYFTKPKKVNKSFALLGSCQQVFFFQLHVQYIKLLPVVHTSTRIWAVCHLQGWVCTQSTMVHDTDGDTGWQSGTGCCSVGILAGILLHWYPSVEFYRRRNQGTGRSHYWSLQGPVHQTRVGGEAELLWRVAASSFGYRLYIDVWRWQTSSQTLLQKSIKAIFPLCAQESWSTDVWRLSLIILLYILTAGTQWVTVWTHPLPLFSTKLPLLNSQAAFWETMAQHMLFSSLSWDRDHLLSSL